MIILHNLIAPIINSGIGYIFHTIIFPISNGDPSSNSKFNLFVVLFTIIVYSLYFSILESSRLKASFGKWFVGFEVVGTDRKQITFIKAFFRFWMKLISILTVFGVLIIDLNKKQKSLHDYIMKTSVRRRRKRNANN